MLISTDKDNGINTQPGVMSSYQYVIVQVYQLVLNGENKVTPSSEKIIKISLYE